MSAKALLDLVDQTELRLDRWQCGPPITHVYRPLRYARSLHADYLRKFGKGKGRILLLGMNPGPWGMAQTGVPFGEVAAVRDWMGVRGDVDAVPDAHPARPVLGLECTRNEVSGARLWGWARERYITPAAFFERFFVVNYCPLLFLVETSKTSARNVTPDKLSAEERRTLFAICDEHLSGVLTVLKPSMVLGVGTFARGRAEAVIASAGIDCPIGQVLHPSPASPAANRDWAGTFEKQLAALGVP